MTSARCRPCAVCAKPTDWARIGVITSRDYVWCSQAHYVTWATTIPLPA